MPPPYFQIQGGQQYRPPRMDPNAPDLYIPIMAAWTYIILLCGNALIQQTYVPDIMYAMVGDMVGDIMYAIVGDMYAMVGARARACVCLYVTFVTGIIFGMERGEKLVCPRSCV